MFHLGSRQKGAWERNYGPNSPWVWVYPGLAGRRKDMGEELCSQQSLGLSPVLLEGQSHVLFHLLQAVIVRVDEVKRQRYGEWAVPPAWRHP